MVLQSIKFNSESGGLEILDQLLLPEKTQYIKIKGVEDGWSVINKMQVRAVINLLFVCGCKHCCTIIYNRKISALILGTRGACDCDSRKLIISCRDLE